MRPRQLPGLAVLGLLASLLAHAMSYGESHQVGGGYHQAVELLALTGAGVLAVLAGSLACVGARRYATGSVLAARLRTLVPPLPLLAAAATIWFALIESVEPPHPYDAPILLIALSLAAAAAAISFLFGWLLRAIAEFAFAIASRPFVRRPVCYRRRFAHRSSARRAVFVYRRFARPPPGVMLLPV
ncbi:MAG TPA: hypothetical protein VMF11_07430 [Candidatus Baltobacteraceae bacterium]|nr:hypothetical protein [Candidatus Baltobacteraceae bacterium]